MPIVQSNDIEYNEICALVRRLRWFSCFFLSLNLFSFYLCTEKGAKKYDFIEEHYRERDKHERRRKKNEKRYIVREQIRSILFGRLHHCR